MSLEREWIRRVQSGEKDAFGDIVQKYEPLIVSSVERCLTDESFTRSDGEDLRQEAVITLYNAVLSFDTAQSEVTFGLYAKICLSNSLASAVRKRTRQLAAERAILAGEEIAGPEDGDAELLMERIRLLLSEFEFRVFHMMLRRVPKKEIARFLGVGEKAVYNAVYRIRSKLMTGLQ